MKKNISTKTLLVFLLSSFLVIGCKTKKIVTEENSLTSYSEEDVFYKIKAANIYFDYLEGSGTATINSPDLNISGNFILRLKDKETAWLVVKKFGLEAARILISKDTVTVLNRLQKSYIQGPVEDMTKDIGLSMGQADIINFLAGNMNLDYGEFVSLKQDSFSYVYKTAFDNLIVDYTYDAISETVNHASFADMSNKSAACAYLDYRVVDDVQMTSYQRILSTDDPRVGETTITLDFKDIILNQELNFPFDIPTNYSKANY